jgi:hypothetical protein
MSILSCGTCDYRIEEQSTGKEGCNVSSTNLPLPAKALLGYVGCASHVPKTIPIRRVWAMPNKWTFSIPPIKELIDRYVGDGKGWIDPFAGMYSPAEFTNDLNPAANAKSHVKALDYVTNIEGIFNGALFDPPFSPRQVQECYNDLGLKVQMDDTNAFFYWSVKRAIAPKIKIGGHAISCGWNSGGFGKKLGFEIVEILLVCHGGSHNDTIVTVEVKER